MKMLKINLIKGCKGLLMSLLLALLFALPALVFAETASSLTLKTVDVKPVSDSELALTLDFDGSPSEAYKSFITHKPPMIVLDIEDAKTALETKQKAINMGPVQGYQIIEAQGRTRLMVELSDAINYRTTTEGNTLNVTLEYAAASASTTEFEPFQDTFVNNDKDAILTTNNELQGIDFKRNLAEGGQVIFDIPNTNLEIDVRVSGDEIIVHFEGATAPGWLQRRYDVIDFATPVMSIDVVQVKNGYDAIIRVNGSFTHLAYQINDQFVVDVNPTTTITAEEQIAKTYQGKRLSLNFQDIKVRAVLQVIADFTGINIVASDTVRGSLTLRLHDVPWDEALAIILRTQGLTQRQVGNILMIAPREEVETNEKQALQAQQQIEILEPLRSELIQINYAQASEIALLLKNSDNTLLSPRGSVSVEERTNTIWVQDTLAKLREVRDLLQKLDRPVRQVLIEARIVRVNKGYERNIGVRFGLTSPDHLSGTFNGANEINRGIKPANVIPATDRLSFNLPAGPINGNPASSIGLALAYLGKDLLLDLELSALESEGGGEIISSPRLITSNKHPAYIEEGTEIPYQEATSSGATSVEFKKAVLSLYVVPQITPDGKVILDLKINQDAVNTTIISEVPAIDTRQIETQVLIDNGDTVVLGGIYEQNRRDQTYRTPYLGALPLVGALFRHTEHSNDRTELLIFLTPKIIHNAFEHD